MISNIRISMWIFFIYFSFYKEEEEEENSFSLLIPTILFAT